ELGYVPWKSSLSSLASIREKIAGSEISEAFDNYTLSIMSNIVSTLSKDLDKPANNHTFALFRSYILMQAVLYGDMSVTTTIFNIFESFRLNSSKIDADLTDVVYTAGIIAGNETQFEFLWDRYLTSL
ncbi:ERAP1-like C-terminal domain-containing protein, partial [Salmonella sp. s51228]|uniref:ERAP1-like C-terminal domain-containing protein n=1 Tax=Salmonella sp. s51228 TaxID=3159652 RepID=UPI00397F88BC